MPFSESLKTKVRKKAHLACCLCKAIGIEIHHIVPQGEGGDDAEDNAAPLCPSCHEIYGANPLKRKFIREARDLWFEICERRYASDAGQLDEIKKLVQSTASQQELQTFKHEIFQFLDGRIGQSLIDRIVEGWARTTEIRSGNDEGHIYRVTDLTIKIAQSMGISDSDIVHIRRGALLHDIGKVAIPDVIILKPAPLTNEEMEIMKRHPAYSHDLLWPIQDLRPALDIPYCHHERWDGTGFPRGLKETNIPLAARIFMVVDVWDSLTTDRPYKKAWSSDDALTELCNQAGHHFDPKVIEHFIKIINPL